MKIAREYGRVTAKEINRYDKEKRREYTVYLPQFELIEYDPTNGETISEKFVCISKEDGIVECDSELDALKFAINYRDNLNV